MNRHHSNPKFILCLCLLLAAVLAAGCARSGEIAAPASISVQAADGSQISVSWEGAEKADYYRLYRKSSDGTDYQYLSDVTETAYMDSLLSGTPPYSYKVEAIYDGQASPAAESAPISPLVPPFFTLVQSDEDGSVQIAWSEMGGDLYHLYSSTDGESWRLLSEQPECEYTLEDPSGITRICVSAIYQTTGGRAESLYSEPAWLPSACRITSVTQMDQYTAVVQYEGAEEAEAYQILRSPTPDGIFSLAGTSYDMVYYDQIAEGETWYYQVQPVTSLGTWQSSGTAALGTNPQSVFGVPVFMYHEFVTQQDLDAGIAFDEYAIWDYEFEQDLIYLRDNGYTTITTAQLSDYLNGRGTLPEKPVILTIDDGKLGVYKHAWPLLQKYGMTGVLAVIGEEIDAATNDPESRMENPAPFCTWAEIQEMARSGSMEIVSHSYYQHRYANNGRVGADMASGGSEEAFYLTAVRDYQQMEEKLEELLGHGTVTLSYPYSRRSAGSDRVWMRCGYQILLAGNDSYVRQSYLNYYVTSAGINYYSAVTRRIVRMTGTPLSTYLTNALSEDQ